MAHKTFISYKFSESQDLRDKIIKALGEDAKYYTGETSDSPDLTDTSTENIKNNLKDMIFGTTVTIVIISPKMIESKWIEWEIEYSLKEISRDEKTSGINGIVAVVKKVNNSYDWFIEAKTNYHGESVVSYKLDLVPEIISANCFNSTPQKIHCNQCQTFDRLQGSYISFIEEEGFLKTPNYYINNAYEKSLNAEKNYNLKRKK